MDIRYSPIVFYYPQVLRFNDSQFFQIAFQLICEHIRLDKFFHTFDKKLKMSLFTVTFDSSENGKDEGAKKGTKKNLAKCDVSKSIAAPLIPKDYSEENLEISNIPMEKSKPQIPVPKMKPNSRLLGRSLNLKSTRNYKRPAIVLSSSYSSSSDVDYSDDSTEEIPFVNQPELIETDFNPSPKKIHSQNSTPETSPNASSSASPHNSPKPPPPDSPRHRKFRQFSSENSPSKSSLNLETEKIEKTDSDKNEDKTTDHNFENELINEKSNNYSEDSSHDEKNDRKDEEKDDDASYNNDSDEKNDPDSTKEESESENSSQFKEDSEKQCDPNDLFGGVYESGVTKPSEIAHLRSFMTRLRGYEIPDNLIPYKLEMTSKISWHGKKVRFVLSRGNSPFLFGKLKNKTNSVTISVTPEKKAIHLAYLLSESNFNTFSLRKGSQFGTELMNIKFKMPHVDYAPRLVELYLCKPPEGIPNILTNRKPRFTAGSTWILNISGRIAKKSTKNCILVDENDTEIMSVMKSKDSEMTIETNPAIGELCVFGLGLSSMLCKL
ncbi:hypothetical protein TRFO_07145 [Tritrichomonas foetus]|uniref:Uncharacterized protein n=1 Tax=Tritrichomonas foetus TaxID=1144522 RepID=A0A1J4JXT3_9EUKA|nr:hypothetical protein TRFO_07145 [Tritrichomonas foetus]|eukprot:OHT02326.1 hypothetical protein TRFO_07145 [Tritrichomonas foetus]